MFLIYGKPDCNSCAQAKQLLDKFELDYVYKVLGADYDLKEFYLIAPRNHRAFPMVAKIEGGNKTYIGSLQELKAFISK